jgi:hypothetical protein
MNTLNNSDLLLALDAVGAAIELAGDDGASSVVIHSNTCAKVSTSAKECMSFPDAR